MKINKIKNYKLSRNAVWYKIPSITSIVLPRGSVDRKAMHSSNTWCLNKKAPLCLRLQLTLA